MPRASIFGLGSGTGLVGMVVSKLTASSSSSVKKSVDPYNKINRKSRVRRATFLRWNEHLETFDDLCRSNTTNQDGAKIKFDTLLAGDVMCKKELPALFFKTAQHYLTQKGVLWLCHVPNSTVTHQVVVDAALAAGFSIVAVETKDVVVQDCAKEDLERAAVYKIKRYKM